jgi:UDP-N-acetyl-D-mannosaminuronic acid dehydrogenase
LVATPNSSFEDAVRGADVVVVATHHSEFEGPGPLAMIRALASPEALVVDPWDSLGGNAVFAPVAEVAAALADEAV